MTQHRRRHGADILERHGGPAVQAPRAPCRPAAATGRRADRRPIAPTAARSRARDRPRRRTAASRARGAPRSRSTFSAATTSRTSSRARSICSPVATAVDLRLVARRRLRQNRALVRRARVVDHHVQHEAIELRFRQRIGAFLLDRILRRQHEQRPIELMADAADGDLVFLHRLEQRGLRLRRRAIDLVGEDDVREDRPGHEADAARSGGAILLDHLGADDVRRHQVRRELDAAELQVHRLRRAS